MPRARTCPDCGLPRTIQQLDPAALTALLRATLAEHERPLIGYPAIQAQLAAWRVTTREAAAPAVATLRRWRARRRLPVAVLPGRAGSVWTTTHLLAAWLLSDAWQLLVARDRRPDGRWVRRSTPRPASATALTQPSRRPSSAAGGGIPPESGRAARS